MRCGFGDRTGGGLLCDSDLVCSNMLTSELVGGMGVSSVGLSRPACCARATAIGSVLASFVLPTLGAFCCLESSLASTFPTLPGGGSTSRSFTSRSGMIGLFVVGDMGFIGLYRAAASLAAIFEGDGIRSATLWSGTARALELLDLPTSTQCQHSSAACYLMQLRQCIWTSTYSAIAWARHKARQDFLSSHLSSSSPKASQISKVLWSAAFHRCLLS